MKNANLNHYCFDDKDWYNQIEKLILDKQKREKIGKIGRKYADNSYSNEKIIKKWDIVYSKVLKELKN